jgi:hypothetical protein
MSDEDNRLRIETDGLTVEWTGDADQIEKAYRTSRSLVREAFRDATADDETPPNPPSRDESADTDTPGNPPDHDELSGRDTGRTASVVQLVVYRDNYTKVCLLERTELADSFLAGAIEPSAVSRMYVDADTYERLRERLTVGETLWRELTPAGQREVATRSQSFSEESTD